MSDFTESKQTEISSNIAVDFAHDNDSELDKPPDGGLQAWLQVLGVHLTIFNTWYVKIFTTNRRILTNSNIETIRGYVNVCFLLLLLAFSFDIHVPKIKPNDSRSISIVLRNISILLCRDSQYSSLGGLLGGLYPDIPSFLPRSIHRPGSRRWLFPATLVCRFHLGCDWDIHRFFCDYILAITTLTRCLRRYWIWNDILSYSGIVLHLLS